MSADQTDAGDPTEPADIANTGTTEPGTGTTDADTYPGQAIVQASWAGTVAFAVTAILGTAISALDVVALVVSLALFAAGTVAFFTAYVRAVNRSRTDEIGVLNLFFLDRSAPRPVRLSLLASLVVELVVAVATAALRTNTSIAFGILAPIYGLALCGLWGARYGTFPKRQPKPARNRQPKPARNPQPKPMPKPDPEKR